MSSPPPPCSSFTCSCMHACWNSQVVIYVNVVRLISNTTIMPNYYIVVLIILHTLLNLVNLLEGYVIMEWRIHDYGICICLCLFGLLIFIDFVLHWTNIVVSIIIFILWKNIYWTGWLESISLLSRTERQQNLRLWGSWLRTLGKSYNLNKSITSHMYIERHISSTRFCSEESPNLICISQI